MGIYSLQRLVMIDITPYVGGAATGIVLKIADWLIDRHTTWRKESRQAREQQERTVESLEHRLQESESRHIDRERQYTIILNENAHLRAHIERLNIEILELKSKVA